MSSVKETASKKILPHIDPGSLDYIIYHKNCPDGFGAAYSAWKKLGTKATYHAAVHNEPPPSDLSDKHVGIFDFTYSRSIIKELEKKAKLVVIVDHHLSAKLDFFPASSSSISDKDEKKSNYHFDMDKSGARLAWEFFWPDKPVPSMIKYIEDKDLFRFLLPKSREFSTYWEVIPLEFEEYNKFVEDESLINNIQEIGAHILKYRDSKVTYLLKNVSYKRKMTLSLKEAGKDNKIIPKTYSVSVINSSMWQSELGNNLMKSNFNNNDKKEKSKEKVEECDFSMIWYYDGNDKQYNISLRSIDEKADVSQIAKHFGGGGHRNASGFAWKEASLETLFDKE
nr:7268_t:CDS:2 [Entrophospora candida]